MLIFIHLTYYIVKVPQDISTQEYFILQFFMVLYTAVLPESISVVARPRKEVMNPTLYFLTKTEYLIGQVWYYKRGLNYERFCVQIVLAIESNNRLAYEWNIMQEYTNVL
jgi:hypothetical protein